jgi:GPH family glycoside/pentoside/hexuronide:cation symporter
LKQEATTPPPSGSFSWSRTLVYALGEGTNSLVMNGVLAFALIYYTKALGMNPFWAGVTMSVSMFWEAVSEPLMGHISDNTRSRWGRRHPHMVLGGGLMAVGCYLICAVPEVFRGSPGWTFWYLVTINLILRTGLTMFFIPYMALGFEICSDYQGRSRLQAVRVIFNIIINFAGPAMAWTVFFRDQWGIQGTTVASNHRNMVQWSKPSDNGSPSGNPAVGSAPKPGVTPSAALPRVWVGGASQPRRWLCRGIEQVP